MNKILIESQYLGSIQYFAKFIQYPVVIIEKYEHYVKGSYRNRCYIASPNGQQMLSIPLEKGKNQHTVMKDVKISYADNWQRNHWHSLEAAYRRSPYFEFYEDKLFPFYNTPYTYLQDFTLKLTELILELIGIETELEYSDQYRRDPGLDTVDFRSKIHPNPQKTAEDSLFKAPEYIQVFQERNGFFPNLSIADLLFNEGPNTFTILKESCLKNYV